MKNADGAYRIILASASPRRKELLEMMGLSFTVEPSDADETVMDGIAPCFQVRDLALKKALLVAQANPGNLVIGADTLVCFEGRMLGKPADADEAREMLRLLSGKTHQVMTGIAIVDTIKDISLADYEVTDVVFREISAEEIDDYVLTCEPFDKAGAYAIQGKASVFVKAVCGCYYNVVGLPVYQLSEMLDSIAFNVTKTWGKKIAQR